MIALVLVALFYAPPALSAESPALATSPGQDTHVQELDPPASAAAVQAPDDEEDEAGTAGDRIFGVLPNHTTVEGATRIQPVSSKDVFHMAAQDAFDKPVFPFVAFTTWLAGVQGEEAAWGRGTSAYTKRYATTFSDDAIATFMTTAVMPTLLRQDPRYFQLGTGSPWQRAWYASSRSFVTRGHLGHSQFNYSDVGGNFIAAGLSNLYHPVDDRTWSGTLTRWGTQMMWDVLSDELKEFWPDIRRRMRRP